MAEEKITPRKVAGQPELPIQEWLAGLAMCGKRVVDGSASSDTARRDRVISLIRNCLAVGFHPVVVAQTSLDGRIVKIRS
jgi:hypothetical protein